VVDEITRLIHSHDRVAPRIDAAGVFLAGSGDRNYLGCRSNFPALMYRDKPEVPLESTPEVFP
jgi:hypothetical protein